MELEKKLLKEKLGDIVFFNQRMENHSTLKIGGKPFALILPNNEKQLIKAIKLVKKLNIPFRVIGAGSNILFSSNLSNLCIISTKLISYSSVDIKKQRFIVSAGEKLSTCYSKTSSLGLSGFEPLFMIPGTVGGAIANNAGAFGVEIKDILESVRVLSGSGKVKNIKKEELNLTYRNSKFKHCDDIVLSACFKLKLLAPSVISHIAREMMKIRRETQPAGLSAGSVFKKHNGESAGKLIEMCGLKGYTIGGCMISDIHANFIINKGTAKPVDYKKLVQYIQRTVKKQFNVDLEREVEYI